MAGKLEMPSCVRGYRIYWSPVMGETLPCAREPTNSQDRYEEGWSYSRTRAQKDIKNVLTVFEKLGRNPVHNAMIGGHCYSSDLEQGGMKTPCLLLVKGKPRNSVIEEEEMDTMNRTHDT
jgi:hypothetical protein